MSCISARAGAISASRGWCLVGFCPCHPLPLSPLNLLQDPRDDVSGEKLVADDMLQFLQEFFEGEQVVEGFWPLAVMAASCRCCQVMSSLLAKAGVRLSRAC